MSTNGQFQQEESAQFLESKKLIDEFISIAHELGASPRPASIESFNRFALLPLVEQERVLKSLKGYLEFLADVRSEVIDISIDTELGLTLRVLKKLNLLVDGDVLDTLQDSNVIEIYSSDEMIQLYRNFTFMNISNYSLLDVLVNSYTDLFERPKFLDKLIARETESCLRKKCLMKWNVPTHELKEKNTKEQQVFRIEHKYIAPVYDNDFSQVAGVITILQATPL